MEPDSVQQTLLYTALAMGERQGWDAVHLHEVAHEAGVSLRDLIQFFRDKDAIAEAWFDTADQALLRAAERPGWAALPTDHRLHAAIFTWLDALSAHRKLTAQMLRYKLQPDHLHLQALGAVRVSRTVQSIREVALLPHTGWQREASEIALTAIYLAAFASWLADGSPGAHRTHALLAGMLRTAGRLAPA